MYVYVDVYADVDTCDTLHTKVHTSTVACLRILHGWVHAGTHACSYGCIFPAYMHAYLLTHIYVYMHVYRHWMRANLHEYAHIYDVYMFRSRLHDVQARYHRV